MDMYIAKQKKLSYIRDKTMLTIESDKGYEKWYTENKKNSNNAF